MSKLEVVSINKHQPEDEIMSRAARILENGGLVVSPTETRYGLLGQADNRETLEKLYQAKSRVTSLPTALFVDNREMIFEYGEENEVSRFLAEKYLPGPMTLVLKASKNLNSPLVVEGKIGIRLSSSPVIQDLVERMPFPLTATSANLTGQPEHDTIEEIVDALGESVELYLDAGVLNNPISTVVDCSEGKPRILRDGAIAAGDIRDALTKAGLDA